MSVLNRALRLLQVSVVVFTTCVCLSCRTEVAKPDQGFAGTWVMTLGQRMFMVLTIEPQGQAFTARIQAPASFDLPAAGSPLRYSHIQLPIKDRRSTRATVDGDHLHIVIDDPANPGEPDEFDLTLSDPGHASLQFAGVPVAPMPFTRHAGPPLEPATDWDSNRIYSVQVESTTSNEEMASIYDDDQKVRQNGFSTTADWAAIEKADRVRRERVAALLAAGALHTPNDYRKAAFVFQHGEQPDDYLLAHTLALVAVAKGDQGAAWIAAATLDRYLVRASASDLRHPVPWRRRGYYAEALQPAADLRRVTHGAWGPDSGVTSGALEDPAVARARQVASRAPHAGSPRTPLPQPVATTGRAGSNWQKCGSPARALLASRTSSGGQRNRRQYRTSSSVSPRPSTVIRCEAMEPA